jgi:hypothetical protein
MTDITSQFSPQQLQQYPQLQTQMQGQQPGSAPSSGPKQLPPEQIQQYLNKGAGGLEQLYLDTGMPQKATQMKQLQDSIQQQVYDGNARLFDQPDRDKLIQSAQMAKAVSDQVQQTGDSEKGIGRITDALKSIGGPDLTGFDPDIQAQGLHLWNSTFQQQMASIAASPRGRELYGDVLNSVYDNSKNPYMMPMTQQMFQSSEQGNQANAITDKLMNPNSKGTFWDKDIPNSSQSIQQSSEQQPNQQGMSESSIRQLISDGKTALTSTPSNDVFDLDKALMVAHKLEDSGAVAPGTIDYSSPSALRASLFKPISAMDTNETLQLGASNKDMAPIAAQVKGRNEALSSVYDAQAAVDAAPIPPQGSPPSQQELALQAANKNLIQFNTSPTGLLEKPFEQYTAQRKPLEDQLGILQSQLPDLQNLFVEKLKLAQTNPELLGSGTTAEKIHEYVKSLAGAYGSPEAMQQAYNSISQALNDPNAPGSRENVALYANKVAGQLMKSAGGRGPEIMNTYANALVNSDVGATGRVVSGTYNAMKNIQNNLDDHETYVGMHGSLTGAPSLYKLDSNDFTDKVIGMLPPAVVTNRTTGNTDGASAQNKLDVLGSNIPVTTSPTQSSSTGYSLADIQAEKARRGLK